MNRTLSFNEWIAYINKELEVTKARVADVKEDRVPIHQHNTHSEFRWSTKEALKPRHRDELNRQKKPKI